MIVCVRYELVRRSQYNIQMKHSLYIDNNIKYYIGLSFHKCICRHSNHSILQLQLVVLLVDHCPLIEVTLLLHKLIKYIHHYYIPIKSINGQVSQRKTKYIILKETTVPIH